MLYFNIMAIEFLVPIQIYYEFFNGVLFWVCDLLIQKELLVELRSIICQYEFQILAFSQSIPFLYSKRYKQWNIFVCLNFL